MAATARNIIVPGMTQTNQSKIAFLFRWVRVFT